MLITHCINQPDYNIYSECHLESVVPYLTITHNSRNITVLLNRKATYQILDKMIEVITY